MKTTAKSSAKKETAEKESEEEPSKAEDETEVVAEDKDEKTAEETPEPAKQGKTPLKKKDFFEKNYEPVNDAKERAYRFVRHIAVHLKKGQYVCCKICGKTIDQINEQA